MCEKLHTARAGDGTIVQLVQSERAQTCAQPFIRYRGTAMSDGYQVSGNNEAALFTLKLHRGDGMLLVAMNWRNGKPPEDFVGFAIEYKEPGGDRFFALKNRICFREDR